MRSPGRAPSSAGAASALAWSLLVAGCGLLLMRNVGAVHPAIRTGSEEDPGTAALHLGRRVRLGFPYRAIPLS